MFTKKYLVSATSGRFGKVRWRDVLEYFSFIFCFFISISLVNLVSLLLNDMTISGIFLLFLVPLFLKNPAVVDSGWKWLMLWSKVK